LSISEIILFEISHLHYLEAGVTAWDFYEKLISKGYNIFHENGLKKVMSRNEFLRSCADFSSSCNVVITKRQTI
jgi:ABC-type polysaccharide/polyol phosphate export permease